MFTSTFLPPEAQRTSKKRGQKEHTSCQVGRRTLKCSLLEGIWLWHSWALSSCGYLHMIKQSKSNHGWGRSSWGSSPSWGAVGGWLPLWEGESFFFWTVAISRLPMLLWMALHPSANECCKPNTAYKKKKKKDMKLAGKHRFGGGLREGGEGIGGEYDQIHCIHTEFL